MDYSNGYPGSFGNNSVAVVVPTYNEAGNIPELMERLFALDIDDLRLIIVDDNSPDGTAEVAKSLEGKFGRAVEVIHRESKQGLGTAYVSGFSQAIEEGAEYIVQMDADLSHAPEYIPAFIDDLGHSDVVVGSRYIKGGGVDKNWTIKRKLLSHWANFFVRTIVGLKSRDVTSGFKAYRASALRKLPLDSFRCKGFAFQVEVAHACQNKGLRVAEHPIVFVDRTQGESKLSMFIMREALWQLLRLRWRRYPRQDHRD